MVARLPKAPDSSIIIACLSVYVTVNPILLIFEKFRLCYFARFVRYVVVKGCKKLLGDRPIEGSVV